MSSKHLTPSERDAVRQAYKEGDDVTAIMARFRITRPDVYYLLSQTKMGPRHQFIGRATEADKPEKRKKIVDKYIGRKPVQDICKEERVALRTVHRVLREEKIGKRENLQFGTPGLADILLPPAKIAAPGSGAWSIDRLLAKSQLERTAAVERDVQASLAGTAKMIHPTFTNTEREYPIIQSWRNANGE